MCDKALGACICQAGYHLTSGDGRCAPDLGTQCREPEDVCDGQQVVCGGATSLCHCNTGYVPDNQICYKQLAGLGEKCEVGGQCEALLGAGAVCDAGACRCDDHHKLTNVSTADKDLNKATCLLARGNYNDTLWHATHTTVLR